MSFQIQNIDHVTIVVRDLAATHQFYSDLLGLPPAPRPAFTFAGQWFRAGDTWIHTILEHDQSGPAGVAHRQGSRGHHFAFLVDDAEAAYLELVARGVEFIGPPKLRPDGAVQCFLRDPDGHLVELTSEPPAAASS